MPGLDFGFAVSMADNISANAKKARQEVNNLNNAIKRLSKSSQQTSSLTQSTNTLTTSAKHATTAVREEAVAVDSATTSLKRAERQSNLTTTAFRVLSRAAVGLAGYFGIRAIVKTGADFEQGMRNVQSVTGASEEQLRSMGKSARTVAVQLGASGQDTTSTLYSLGSAGLNTAAAIKALPTTMQLATATQSDFQTSTETLTAAMAIFKKDASQVPEIANTIVQAIGASPANMQRWSDAFKQFGSIAATTGKTIQETSAHIAAMHAVGYRGERAGTVLRNVWAKLLQPTDNLKEVTKFLGVNLIDLNPKFNKLGDIVQRMQPLLNDSAKAMKLFGAEAAPGFLALLNYGKPAIEKLEASMAGAASLAEVYDIQMNSFSGTMKRLGAATEEVALVIWDFISPTLVTTAKAVYSTVTALIESMERYKTVIQAGLNLLFTTVKTGWGAIKSIAAGFYEAITGATGAASTAKKSILDVVAPLTILLTVVKYKVEKFSEGLFAGIISGIKDVITPFVTLGKWIAKAVLWFTDLIGLTDGSAESMRGWGFIIGKVVGWIIAFKVAKWALSIPMSIISTWVQYGKTAREALAKTAEFIVAIPSKLQYLAGMAQMNMGRLILSFQAAGAAVYKFATVTLIQLVRSAAAMAVAGLSQAIAGLPAVFAAARTAVAAFNATLLANPIGLIVAGAIALGVAIGALVYYWEDVTKAVGNAWDATTNWFSNVFEAAPRVGAAVKDYLVESVGVAWASMTSTAKELFFDFGSTVESISRTFHDYFRDGVAAGMRNIWSDVVGSLKSNWTSFVSYFKSAWEKVKDIFTSFHTETKITRAETQAMIAEATAAEARRVSLRASATAEQKAYAAKKQVEADAASAAAKVTSLKAEQERKAVEMADPAKRARAEMEARIAADISGRIESATGTSLEMQEKKAGAKWHDVTRLERQLEKMADKERETGIQQSGARELRKQIESKKAEAEAYSYQFATVAGKAKAQKEARLKAWEAKHEAKPAKTGGRGRRTLQNMPSAQSLAKQKAMNITAAQTGSRGGGKAKGPDTVGFTPQVVPSGYDSSMAASTLSEAPSVPLRSESPQQERVASSISGVDSTSKASGRGAGTTVSFNQGAVVIQNSSISNVDELVEVLAPKLKRKWENENRGIM